MGQWIALYGIIQSFRRLLEDAGTEVLFSACEDSWYSSALAQALRADGRVMINVMHGNCYAHDQFFDLSLVFGRYHADWLTANTSSRTRFVISGSATIKDTGATPRPELAGRLIHFDQPACEAFPLPIKTELLGMLGDLLSAVPGLALSIKPHPAADPEELADFHAAYRQVPMLEGNDRRSVAQVLEGNGISLTAYSTTGLEAIANGVASLFLNPGGALSEGPLAFMGDFVLADADALIRLVIRLRTDPEFYREYVDRQKRALERHYALGPFDYAACLRGLGLEGGPQGSS
jgi:hypothetical protein